MHVAQLLTPREQMVEYQTGITRGIANGPAVRDVRKMVAAVINHGENVFVHTLLSGTVRKGFPRRD